MRDRRHCVENRSDTLGPVSKAAFRHRELSRESVAIQISSRFSGLLRSAFVATLASSEPSAKRGSAKETRPTPRNDTFEMGSRTVVWLQKSRPTAAVFVITRACPETLFRRNMTRFSSERREARRRNSLCYCEEGCAPCSRKYRRACRIRGFRTCSREVS